VDSASIDGTPELVEKWVREHSDVELMLVREPSRRGMVPAINYVLQNYILKGEVVILTDADAYWPLQAIKKIAKYFKDSSVGVVTTSITYDFPDCSESAYRLYYNMLRTAESKKWSTPICNGPLVAFRKELLYRMGLLPEYTGNDDSTPASIIAFMGFRAIHVDDVVVNEYIRGSQFLRKVRRAQHLLLHFLRTKRYVKEKRLYVYIDDFELIWKIEWWLFIVNPLILATSITLLVLNFVLTYSTISILLLFAGACMLVIKSFRTWVTQQLYLVLAFIENMKSNNLAWKKMTYRNKHKNNLFHS
ncbi:MAG: glycosyltransferase, partial [Candidatus Nezhaarchaeota archaeon]|nr:glycosyltransferase [Candidatus Nezhaarchaeota archaeon]